MKPVLNTKRRYYRGAVLPSENQKAMFKFVRDYYPDCFVKNGFDTNISHYTMNTMSPVIDVFMREHSNDYEIITGLFNQAVHRMQYEFAHAVFDGYGLSEEIVFGDRTYEIQEYDYFNFFRENIPEVASVIDGLYYEFKEASYKNKGYKDPEYVNHRYDAMKKKLFERLPDDCGRYDRWRY